jgi:hypothetical protein
VIPWWLQAFGYLAGLFLALAVGVWLGDYRRALQDTAALRRLATRNRRLHLSRVRWRRHAHAWHRYAVQLENDLVGAERSLAAADQALAEYREAIPEVWDRAFEAGQHIAEFQLARASVEQAERSTARWN